MSNSRSHYWPASVDEAVSRAQWLDSFTIIWMDASQSSNVLIRRGKFTNHTVETRVTSEGRFLIVQDADYSSIPHILILKDVSDSHRGTVQSIPLPIVREIDNHGGSQAKKQLISRKYSEVLAPILEMRRKNRRNKTTVKFADGSVKHVGGW